ncbi:hypothetical protein BJV82DRAFT_666444 [Fennellomyces sp. T-0311]|nr:hypothetical protein BJV82DRAFT_666444 [Fennellomyces sp. T-0311]
MHGITLASTLLVLSVVRFNEAASLHKTGISNAKDTGLYHHLRERQIDEDDFSICPLSNPGENELAAIYNHFGFMTFSGRSEFYGSSYTSPIAAFGDTYFRPSGNVSQSNPSTCTNTSDINSYGFLHTGGPLSYGPNFEYVYGNILVDNPDTVVDLATEGDNCGTFSASESVVNFDNAFFGLLYSSNFLSKLKPDLKLTNGNTIGSIRDQENPHYQVLTLNTCTPPVDPGDTTTCSGLSYDQLSDPSAILFGDGVTDWSGPSDQSVYANAETIVINVPITIGSTLTISTPNFSEGFDACRLIFNFYPVNASGDYDNDISSEVTLATSGILRGEGFLLGPKVDLDATNARAGGKIFMKRMRDGQNMGMGGLTCATYVGCLPFSTTSSSSASETTITVTESTSTSTRPITTSYSPETITTTVGTPVTEYTTITKTTEETTTVVSSTTTETTHLSTVPVTLQQTSTYGVYYPVEVKEHKKWSGKGDKGWGKADKWSEKDGKWSGRKGGWSGDDKGWYGNYDDNDWENDEDDCDDDVWLTAEAE